MKFPDTLTIKLEQRHIDLNLATKVVNGIAPNGHNRCADCPVALATIEAFMFHNPALLKGRHVRVCQVGIGIYASESTRMTTVYYNIPGNVTAFITAADMMWADKPFSKHMLLAPITFDIFKIEDNTAGLPADIIEPITFLSAPTRRKAQVVGHA